MHLTSAYLAVFLMGSIAAPVVAQPLETPAYDQGLQAFAAELNSLRKAHSIPGLSIVVLRDQKIVLSRGYGFSDPDRTVPGNRRYDANDGQSVGPVQAPGLLRHGPGIRGR
jgi:CubicO group peptidase (beta-lactamase class C family)